MPEGAEDDDTGAPEGLGPADVGVVLLDLDFDLVDPSIGDILAVGDPLELGIQVEDEIVEPLVELTLGDVLLCHGATQAGRMMSLSVRKASWSTGSRASNHPVTRFRRRSWYTRTSAPSWRAALLARN